MQINEVPTQLFSDSFRKLLTASILCAFGLSIYQNGKSFILNERPLIKFAILLTERQVVFISYTTLYSRVSGIRSRPEKWLVSERIFGFHQFFQENARMVLQISRDQFLHKSSFTIILLCEQHIKD